MHVHKRTSRCIQHRCMRAGAHTCLLQALQRTCWALAAAGAEPKVAPGQAQGQKKGAVLRSSVFCSLLMQLSLLHAPLPQCMKLIRATTTNK